MTLYSIVRPMLYRFDAEQTHEWVLSGLKRLSSNQTGLRLARTALGFDDPRLAVELFGKPYRSPLAIAAGLDKHAVAVPAFEAFGFALTEIGTVTPLPQAGNPKPRIFRLPEEHALINRMGFPGPGMEVVAANLLRAGGDAPFALNVGPNKERVDHASEECLTVIRRLAPLEPEYIVINISSPNTQRLRTLQGKEALNALVGEIVTGLPETAKGIPLLIKIAPDLDERELEDILQVATDHRLPGIVATNTTITRPDGLRGKYRGESGGLSGAPLRDRSTAMVSRIYKTTSGSLQIVAAGGVFSGADALDKIGAGAMMVQTYSGLIYEGPGMAKRVKKEMSAALDRQGIMSLNSIRGTGYRAIHS